MKSINRVRKFLLNGVGMVVPLILKIIDLLTYLILGLAPLPHRNKILFTIFEHIFFKKLIFGYLFCRIIIFYKDGKLCYDTSFQFIKFEPT